VDFLGLAWSIVYNVGVAAFIAYAAFRFITTRRLAPSLVPLLAVVGAYALVYGEIPFTGIKFPWQPAVEMAKGILDASIAQVEDAHKAFAVMTTETGGAKLAANLAATIARGATIAEKVVAGGVSLPLKIALILTNLDQFLTDLLFGVYNTAFKLLGQAGFALYVLRTVLDMWPVFVLAGAAVTAINIDEESTVAAGLGIMYFPALLAIAISIMPPLVLNAQSLGQPIYTGLFYYDDGDYPIALTLQSADGKRVAVMYQDVAALPVTSESGTDYVVKEFVWAGLDIRFVFWRLEWVKGSLTNSTLPPPSNATMMINMPVHVPAVLVNYTNLTPAGNHSPLVRVINVSNLFCGQVNHPYSGGWYVVVGNYVVQTGDYPEYQEVCRGWMPVNFLGWTNAWVPQVEISSYSFSVSSTVSAYRSGDSSRFEGSVSWSCSGYADECTITIDLNPIAAPNIDIADVEVEKSDYVSSATLTVEGSNWLGYKAELFEKVWRDLKSRNFTLDVPNNELGDLGTAIREHLKAVQSYNWSEVRQGRLVLTVTAEPKIHCEQVGNSTVCYEVPTDRWVRIKWKSAPSPYAPPPPLFVWIAPPPYEEFNKSLSMLVASAALIGDRRLGNFNALPALTNQNFASWFFSQFKPPLTMDFQPPKPTYGPFAVPQGPGGCSVNPSHVWAAALSVMYPFVLMFAMTIQPACDVVAKISTWFASLWWNILTVFALATVFSALAGSGIKNVLGGMVGRTLMPLVGKLTQPRPPARLPNPLPYVIDAVGYAQSRLAALTPVTGTARAAVLVARGALMGANFFLKFLDAANMHVFQALTRALFAAIRGSEWLSRHIPRLPAQVPGHILLYYHRLAAAGHQRIADAVYYVGAALYHFGRLTLTGLSVATSVVGSIHSRLRSYEGLIDAVVDVTSNMRINPLLRQASAKVAEAYYYLSAAYGRRSAAVWIATHPHRLRPSAEEVVAFFASKMPSLTPAVVRVDYRKLAELMGLQSPESAARAYLTARAFALGIHREFHPDVAVKMAERGWGAGHPAVDAYLRGGREAGYVAFDAAYRWPFVASAAIHLGSDRLLKAAEVGLEVAKLGVVRDPALAVYLWARGPHVADPVAAATAWSLLEKAPHLLAKLPGFEFLETTVRYPLRVLAAELPDLRMVAHSPVVVWRFAPTEELAFLAALHVRAGDTNAGPWSGKPVDWASEIARHYAVQPVDRLEHLLASVRGGVAETVRHVLAAAKAGGTVPTMAVDPQYPVAVMVAARLAEAHLPEEGAAARAWVKMVTHGYRVSLDEVKSMLFEPPPAVDAATAELYRLSARYLSEEAQRLARNYDYVPAVPAEAVKEPNEDVLKLPEGLRPPSPDEVRAAREAGRLWLADYALMLSPMADALRYLPPMEEVKPAPRPPVAEEVSVGVVPIAELRNLAEAVAALNVQADVWRVWNRWESEVSVWGIGPYVDVVAQSLGLFWTHYDVPLPPQSYAAPLPQPVPQPMEFPEPPKVQPPEEIVVLERAANMPVETAEDERGQAYLRAYIALAEGNFEEAVRQVMHVLPPDVVGGTPIPGETYLERLVRAQEILKRETGTADVSSALKVDPNKLSEEGKAAYEVVKSFVEKVTKEAEKYFRRKMPDRDFPKFF